MRFILPLVMLLVATPVMSQTAPPGSPMATADAARTSRLAAISAKSTSLNAAIAPRLAAKKPNRGYH